MKSLFLKYPLKLQTEDIDKKWVFFRAADWNLQEPQWTGRMRLVSKGEELVMKLEDKTSGQLFAKCPIDKYPGVALESVTDSSRYFVVKIQDDNGRSAYIGLGFGDRSDSFDLNVALQDHFKWLRKEQEGPAAPAQQLDLGFKDGETIKINMKITKKDGSDTKPRRGVGAAAGGGLLPPPPGGSRLPPPPSPQHAASPAVPAAPATSEWGDYNSASAPSQQATTPASQQNWVQF
ncbi:NECAP-like protein CG9132 isoform X2 [Cydia pomonella]|uniref:NECAP-like protein CG9132 isoform X2 n=1 Tax=Cydia pomonella TaxID=82600 RepID=UPI002ADE6CE5|nr:NECAP-like protein CG9132 isoform X2 [Cydia pomonella]XP_061728504.1 NECAP-like protein CG9132 isoform X2 [Cydia pomonella]